MMTTPATIWVLWAMLMLVTELTTVIIENAGLIQASASATMWDWNVKRIQVAV